MADLQIRTTITANSIQRLFGPPVVNYRSHPNQREPDNPTVIFTAMKNKEIAPLSDIKILKGTIYSFKNRKIITRWVRDVCAAFNLRSTTLCLAVQLTDAYIISNLTTLQVAQCQLVAIVCTWIAAKFEETDDMLPSLKSLSEVCDGAYNAEQILAMEEQVLEGFRWRLPHSSCLNFLYLYLHMHGHPSVARQILEIRAAADAAAAAAQQQSASSTSTSRFPAKAGLIAAHIVLADANTKQRQFIPIYIQPEKPFGEIHRDLCAAANVHYTPQIEVYELAGADFLLARRILPKLTPRQLGMRTGNDGEKAGVKLFLSTTAPSTIGSGGGAQAQLAAASSSSTTAAEQQQQQVPAKAAVFAESDDIVILRTVNSLILHMADVLASEVITHVEFLRLPSHVVALGVIALARCLTGRSSSDMNEAKAVIMFIVKTLGISASQSLAAAELLKDKYREALGLGSTTTVNPTDGTQTAVPPTPCTLPKPVVDVPHDISERLKYVFGK